MCILSLINSHIPGIHNMQHTGKYENFLNPLFQDPFLSIFNELPKFFKRITPLNNIICGSKFSKKEITYRYVSRLQTQKKAVINILSNEENRCRIISFLYICTAQLYRFVLQMTRPVSGTFIFYQNSSMYILILQGIDMPHRLSLAFCREALE